MQTHSLAPHEGSDSRVGGAAAATLAGPTRATRRLLLRRMALLCALLMLTIITLSAFIRLSKAEPSCVHWPHCYGRSLLELQAGQVASAGESDATAGARLAHRVVASSTLLLVLAMAALCLGPRPRLRREAVVALALLALALFLAILGVRTGHARLPAVALGNLLGGFAMLALSWRLARPGSASGGPGLRAWAWAGLALLVCQVALGALVSAAFAAASCHELHDCLAASAGASWRALNPWSEPVLAWAAPGNASGALLQVAHRLASAVAALALLALALAALRRGRAAAGALLLLLLALELGLGLLMAGNRIGLALALAHNVLAALLLATTFELTRRAGGPQAD